MPLVLPSWLMPEASITPSLGWLWPDGLGVTQIVDAVLIGVFLYWGWDTAVACNEESDDPGKTPGRAAMLTILIIMVIYLLTTLAVLVFAGIGTEGLGAGNPDNQESIFAALAGPVMGPFALLMSIAILVFSSRFLSFR